MPEFWQFPTVSMGLGPMMAIYQARFMRYMENRELVTPSDRKVWCFLGDGEMDEPESMGAITMPVREGLDNLIFVINCNLQRLDGPVRGNGKIIQELEAAFGGAGWNVIKVVWGSRWDPLLAKDHTGLLQRTMEECVDGEYQNFKSKGGDYVREHFFGRYPETAEMVANMSDDGYLAPESRWSRSAQDVCGLQRGRQSRGSSHGDPREDRQGLRHGRGRRRQNIAHQQKKMDIDALKAFRDRFNLPVSDKDIDDVPYCVPTERQSGDRVPARTPQSARRLSAETTHEDIDAESTGSRYFQDTARRSGDREISTTMAFVRMLTALIRDKQIGKNIVPIVPDEARTFGMEGMFRQVGIYASKGQLYTPQDADQLMFYREDKKGQILEEGINEAGAFCSWAAAGTAYSNHNVPMIPFYIYYSMFGFQRIGDFIWAGGDLQSRGFLMGGTAGRTTLAGEGCSIRTVTASSMPRRCRTASPTTRPMPTSWP